MTRTCLPILYSFRRCPYAMRARLALAASGTTCQLREIVLRDKPPAFLATSPKGTVPVVALPDGTVIEESYDIMLWALRRSDPDEWLTPENGTFDEMDTLIRATQDEFKGELDAYKYASRHDRAASEAARDRGVRFLQQLETRLDGQDFLFGGRRSLADMAIAPFVRQFANVDRDWFDEQNWPALRSWLDTFLASEAFSSIMTRYPQWHIGDPVTVFPEQGPPRSA